MRQVLKDLDKLPGWPEKVKLMQKNRIGRSEGAEVTFKTDGFEGSADLHHPSGYASSAPPLWYWLRSIPMREGTDRRYGVSGGSGSIYGE